jgi:hypothetical protein
MVKFILEFLSLAFMLISLTIATEILGQTYISRKFNTNQKTLIIFLTIASLIIILRFCILSYIKYKL